MWERKKFPLIHNFQEKKSFLKGVSRSRSQVRRGWLVHSLICKGRINCVASQSYGNEHKTHLVHIKVLLFVRMSPKSPHWSIKIVLMRLKVFYIGVVEIINVKSTATSVRRQDCKAHVLPSNGIDILQRGGVSAQTTTMKTELLPLKSIANSPLSKTIGEEQQYSPSQWGHKPQGMEHP